MLQAGAKAFGDGSHPTTLGVLTALESIDPTAFLPRNACDMGSGSGILALAIAKQFACPVVAVDIEREAVATLRDNFAMADMAQYVRPVHADGFLHSEVVAQAPYDLIVMNILAEPLMKLAKEAVEVLADGGVLILSGMLQWQEPQIFAAYETLGLELTSRLTIGDWMTQVWQKPSFV